MKCLPATKKIAFPIRRYTCNYDYISTGQAELHIVNFILDIVV